MNALTDSIKEAAQCIDEASSILILTGAGVSAESGLATFRDPEEGHWSKYDPMELATADAFNRDPELVTRWYHWRFTKARDVEPNPGHRAMAKLEQIKRSCGERFDIVTQNIDGLHQRGGSQRVIEIHGTIHTWRCTETGEETPLDELSFDAFPIPSKHGGLMRPCIVWFGEALPDRAIDETIDALSSCDLFISAGTSATVYPAAGFIDQARAQGARTIEINKDPTQISGTVDLSIQGSTSEIFPKIVQILEAG